jgi:hypothetical protein
MPGDYSTIRGFDRRRAEGGFNDMTFYDAVNASECRCAMRIVKGRRIYRYWDGKIEMETRQGRRYLKFFERLFRARADTGHNDWEPVGPGAMTYDEAIARLELAEERARAAARRT